MNKGEFVAAVADRAGMSRGDAMKAVDAAFETIAAALQGGEGVKVVGFGTFEVVDRRAGLARNPRTGERVSVPASRAPKFRPGAQLKSLVNAGR